MTGAAPVFMNHESGMEEKIKTDVPLAGRTDEIRKYVALLTPIADMAVLMNVDERELRDELDDPASAVSLAYRRAKAQVALELRQKDIELAEAGSPTASEAVAAHYRRMIMDE